MPPPGSVLARGDSLPQTHAGMFRASAQRDREKNFSSLMVILACAGRPALARLLYSAYVQPNLRRLPMHRGSLCTLLLMHSAPYVQCALCTVLLMHRSLCTVL